MKQPFVLFLSSVRILQLHNNTFSDEKNILDYIDMVIKRNTWNKLKLTLLTSENS